MTPICHIFRESTLRLSQPVRFVIVGLLATALHWGLYLLLLHWFAANVAYAAGYVTSFVFNYLASAWFTFRKSLSWSSLVGMIGAHGVNFVLHMVLLNVFLYMGIPNAWAPLPVYAIAVPVNYLLVRFAFHHHRGSATKNRKQ